MTSRTVLYTSRRPRDAVLETGIEGDIAESFDRLAAYLERLQGSLPPR